MSSAAAASSSSVAASSQFPTEAEAPLADLLSLLRSSLLFQGARAPGPAFCVTHSSMHGNQAFTIVSARTIIHICSRRLNCAGSKGTSFDMVSAALVQVFERALSRACVRSGDQHTASLGRRLGPAAQVEDPRFGVVVSGLPVKWSQLTSANTSDRAQTNSRSCDGFHRVDLHVVDTRLACMTLPAATAQSVSSALSATYSFSHPSMVSLAARAIGTRTVTSAFNTLHRMLMRLVSIRIECNPSPNSDAAVGFSTTDKPVEWPLVLPFDVAVALSGLLFEAEEAFVLLDSRSRSLTRSILRFHQVWRALALAMNQTMNVLESSKSPVVRYFSSSGTPQSLHHCQLQVRQLYDIIAFHVASHGSSLNTELSRSSTIQHPELPPNDQKAASPSLQRSRSLNTSSTKIDPLESQRRAVLSDVNAAISWLSKAGSAYWYDDVYPLCGMQTDYLRYVFQLLAHGTAAARTPVVRRLVPGHQHNDICTSRRPGPSRASKSCVCIGMGHAAVFPVLHLAVQNFWGKPVGCAPSGILEETGPTSTSSRSVEFHSGSIFGCFLCGRA